jgi:hypothetical protein
MHEIFLRQIERDIERKGKRLRLKDAAEYRWRHSAEDAMGCLGVDQMGLEWMGKMIVDGLVRYKDLVFSSPFYLVFLIDRTNFYLRL